MMLRRKRVPPDFTGNCPVRQHTADGHYVGRCDHSTYGGVCHVHGDVSRFLADGSDLAEADDRRLSADCQGQGPSPSTGGES